LSPLCGFKYRFVSIYEHCETSTLDVFKCYDFGNIFAEKKWSKILTILTQNIAFCDKIHKTLVSRKIIFSLENNRLKIVIITLAPGVDVMITIFAIFTHFRRKKWRFSQKPML
jgi:hypothetical protein